VREFAPEITRIVSVSGFATPSVWQIETDRGRTELTLKAEEDIRRLAGRTRLLIASASSSASIESSPSPALNSGASGSIASAATSSRLRLSTSSCASSRSASVCGDIGGSIGRRTTG